MEESLDRQKTGGIGSDDNQSNGTRAIDNWFGSMNSKAETAGVAECRPIAPRIVNPQQAEPMGYVADETLGGFGLPR